METDSIDVILKIMKSNYSVVVVYECVRKINDTFHVNVFMKERCVQMLQG